MSPLLAYLVTGRMVASRARLRGVYGQPLGTSPCLDNAKFLRKPQFRFAERSASAAREARRLEAEVRWQLLLTLRERELDHTEIDLHFDLEPPLGLRVQHLRDVVVVQ